jgi:integrase
MTRRYGEGSVYQETSGRWCATLQTTAPDGSTRRLYRRAKTKRAALEKIRKVRSEVDHNVVVPDQRRTTGDWLEWWLSEIVPGTVRSSTLDGYRYIVETYLMPALGSVPLAKLGPQHVQTMLTSVRMDQTTGSDRPLGRSQQGPQIRTPPQERGCTCGQPAGLGPSG